ncbi:MAG: PA2778 family cysteine peptidase [Candidatus Omnitrophica bacterium]|nr:PA2778 family cysteine peptidase [Candidatus Omnitrophota bacterium]
MSNKLILKVFYFLSALVFLSCGCASKQAYIKKQTYAKKQAYINKEPSTGDVFVINKVPFYKQNSNTCGPAALASVLEYWGADFTPENIIRSVYSLELRGTLDFEISYYARQFNFWSKYYQSSFDDLKGKIREGIPLIILEKESPVLNSYHYIVVFGFDEGERRIIAHTGRKASAWIPYNRFFKTWKRGDFGAIVVCPPEKVDWPLDPQGYIYLGYLLEKKEFFDKAAQIYLKAINIEPGSEVAYFNLGNVYVKLNKYTEAEEAFQKTIELNPGFADAYNNLACVYLSENKNLEEAQRLTQKALELNPEGKEYYIDTLDKIREKL